MFIEQSVARRRVVRSAFVLGVVLPSALLVAAAWWRHSTGYRVAIAEEAGRHLGVPVEIGGVAHPRPGVLRLAGVAVGGPPGAGGLTLEEVEVELAGNEVRLRVPGIACSPASARLLAEFAGEWLTRPARFPRAWVIDVAEVTWALDDGRRLAGGGWHVECAAAGAARGLWLRREPRSAEEVRVRVEADAVVAEGRIEAPVPAPILAALLGTGGAWAGTLGPQAMVRGQATASRADAATGWSGSLAGVIERVDLAVLSAAGPRGLGGEATVEVERLQFERGRLETADFSLVARAGTISQELLDGLVANLGCRPGPAYRSIGGETLRRFDDIACRFLVAGPALTIRPAQGDGLIRAQGLPVLEPPVGPQPVSRVAWLVSPAGNPAVPASAVSAWLISVLPERAARAGGF